MKTFSLVGILSGSAALPWGVGPNFITSTSGIRMEKPGPEKLGLEVWTEEEEEEKEKPEELDTITKSKSMTNNNLKSSVENLKKKSGQKVDLFFEGEQIIMSQDNGLEEQWMYISENFENEANAWKTTLLEQEKKDGITMMLSGGMSGFRNRKRLAPKGSYFVADLRNFAENEQEKIMTWLRQQVEADNNDEERVFNMWELHSKSKKNKVSPWVQDWLIVRDNKIMVPAVPAQTTVPQRIPLEEIEKQRFDDDEIDFDPSSITALGMVHENLLSDGSGPDYGEIAETLNKMSGKKKRPMALQQALAYTEGGNALPGRVPSNDGKGGYRYHDYVLIGRDSQRYTKMLLEKVLLANKSKLMQDSNKELIVKKSELLDKVVRLLFAKTYGVQEKMVFFVEQPGTFHLDMGMALGGYEDNNYNNFKSNNGLSLKKGGSGSGLGPTLTQQIVVVDDPWAVYQEEAAVFKNVYHRLGSIVHKLRSRGSKKLFLDQVLRDVAALKAVEPRPEDALTKMALVEKTKKDLEGIPHPLDKTGRTSLFKVVMIPGKFKLFNVNAFNGVTFVNRNGEHCALALSAQKHIFPGWDPAWKNMNKLISQAFSETGHNPVLDYEDFFRKAKLSVAVQNKNNFLEVSQDITYKLLNKQGGISCRVKTFQMDDVEILNDELAKQY